MSHDQQVVRQLPSNLHSTFRSILKLYDAGLYKKAIKAADTILKSHPHHGETLSLKGLALYHSGGGKKKEAWALVRLGLRYDIRSFVCWHVYAIVSRQERLYVETTKALSHALAIQPTNAQVTRDLAQVQAFNRNFEENLRLRQLYMNENPKALTSWTGFVAALHLSGDTERALSVLDSFLKATANTDSFKDPVDSTEIQLYKNQLLEESGNITGALEHLIQEEAKIHDKESLNTKKAEFLRKLDRRDEAEAILRAQIKINPENFDYYLALFMTLGLVSEDTTSLRVNVTSEKVAEICAICDALAKEYPKARAPIVIPLSFVTGDEFKKRFAAVVRDPLTKGTPSLFASLKYLLLDSEKARIAGEVMKEIEKNVETIRKLSPEETLEEPPSTILWVKYYLAQYSSFMGDGPGAIAYLDECIKHTPSCLEFELMKGRVYKDHGDIESAVAHVEEARTMDLADRYLNNKATRYLLRAGRIEEARKMISIYTKAIPSEMVTEYGNVYDLQVNWYALEEGDAWRRNGNLAMALKRYNDVEEHFQQYYNDEFDYHAYCLRKNTLRSYVQTIRYHDRVRDHPFWFRAATRTVETYLELIDNPPNSSGAVDKELEGLTEQERKKVLAKRRKAKAQKEREEAEKRKANEKSGASKKRQGHYDPDPDGEHFLDGKDYLMEADRFAKLLVTNCPNELQTHLLAFSVAIRREKYLQALRALKKSVTLATAAHPDVHFNIIRLAKKVPMVASSLNEHVRGVLTDALAELGAADPKKFNADYLPTATTARMRLSYVRSALYLEASFDAKELEELLVKDLTSHSKTYKDAIEVHLFLLAQEQDALAQQVKEAAAAKYPLAKYFKTS